MKDICFEFQRGNELLLISKQASVEASSVTGRLFFLSKYLAPSPFMTQSECCCSTIQRDSGTSSKRARTNSEPRPMLSGPYRSHTRSCRPLHAVPGSQSPSANCTFQDMSAPSVLGLDRSLDSETYAYSSPCRSFSLLATVCIGLHAIGPASFR